MRSGLPGLAMAGVAALVLGACAIQAPSMRTEPGKDVSVQVEYIQPERFTDIGETFPGGTKRRDANLDELRRHIERRAQRVLGDGQRLQVSITDIDLAGKTEPWHPRMPDTRIVRDVYPPRIDLRFTLTDAEGKVLSSGERHLRDFMFMSSGRGHSSDPLRYEKVLLDDWIEREFGASRGG